MVAGIALAVVAGIALAVVAGIASAVVAGIALAGLPVLLVCGGWCLLYAEDTPPGGWEQCVLRLESRRTGQVRPGRAAPKGASANKLSWTIRRDESPAGAAGCDRCANWDAMNRVSTIYNMCAVGGVWCVVRVVWLGA